MGQGEFKRNRNVVYSCKYHIVWCSKYRRKVLEAGVANRLKAILYEVAEEFARLRSRLPSQ